MSWEGGRGRGGAGTCRENSLLFRARVARAAGYFIAHPAHTHVPSRPLFPHNSFESLRDLLPPAARGAQRADLLAAAVSALRSARRAAAALQAAGMLRALPEDAAFALRALLPEGETVIEAPEAAVVAAPPPVAAATPPAAPPALPPHALLAAALAADGGATALHMLMAAAYSGGGAPAGAAAPPLAPVAKRARVEG